MSVGPIRSAVGDLRDLVLCRAARIRIKSATFRRHLGALNSDYDPDFVSAARLIRGAGDEEALFVRDRVNAAESAHARADQHQDLWVLHETGPSGATRAIP